MSPAKPKSLDTKIIAGHKIIRIKPGRESNTVTIMFSLAF
jgi:hypothetical protein